MNEPVVIQKESEKDSIRDQAVSIGALEAIGWEEIESAIDEVDDKLWEAANDFYKLERSEENLAMLNAEVLLVIESCNNRTEYTPGKYSAIASGVLAIGIAKRMIKYQSGMKFSDVISVICSASQAIGYVKALNNVPVEFAKTTSELLSEIGKRAVSQRSDQLLKPGWIEHCQSAVKSEAEINRLEDLLNIPGYDPLITKISERSLKDWAREAGIKFRPGRPKK